jgi:hypothetical protein
MSGQLFDNFLGRLVDVVLLFLVLSWFSYKLVELVHILINRHGNTLQVELAHCFGEDRPGPFTNYFYWHPLILPLSPPALSWLERKMRRRGDVPEDGALVTCYPAGRRPAYIAPESFASVMVDPFPWPSTREALARMLAANLDQNQAEGMDGHKLREWAAGLLGRRSEVEANMTWQTFLGDDKAKHFDSAFTATDVEAYGDSSDLGRGSSPILDAPSAAAEQPRKPQASETPLGRLAGAWKGNQLPPEELRAGMLSLLREAEGDVDQLRGAVARWYREAMDRATGRFQRASMFAVFGVAFCICLFFNIDLISIGENLLRALSRPQDLPGGPGDIHLLSGPGFGDWPARIHSAAGAVLGAALAGLGAPFWYDLLGKISRRSGRGPTPRGAEGI